MFTEVRDALVAALVIQVLLVGLTSILTGDGGTLGAPIPIGEGAGLFGSDPFHGQRGLIGLGLFIVDVAITALPILAVRHWAGTGSTIAGVVGGVAALVLAGATYVLMATGRIPFAGLPLPIADAPGAHIALLMLWLDCLILAVAFAAGYRLLFEVRSA